MKSFSSALSPSRNVGFLVILACIFAITGGQVRAQATDPDISQLVKDMTLAEKVGQMTQLTMQPISSVRGWPGTPFELDQEKLKEAIVERHIGSLLNVYDMAMTTDQWVDLITQVQSMAINDTRLGIPIIYGIDAVHGNNYHQEGHTFSARYRYGCHLE